MTLKPPVISKKQQSGAGSKNVYLALGSNIRPRKQYLLNSLIVLANRFPDQFLVSGCYVTRPYMGLMQPGYFNCCVSFKTKYSATEILEFIKQLEKNLGRERVGLKWGSRTIDIDILLYGNEIIDLPELVVPHYDISNRDFFIIPLLELHKSLFNPRSKRLINDELSEIPRQSQTFPKRIETSRPCALNYR